MAKLSLKSTCVSLCFIVVGLMVCVSLQAAVDLGRVTHNKIKSFTGYFEPYLKHDPPFYPHEERKQKIVSEARNIFNWLNTHSNWPKEQKITAVMRVDAARLFLYLGRTGIEEAKKKAEEFAVKGATGVEGSFEVLMSSARALVEVGGAVSLDGARAAERALAEDSARAELEYAHYFAAIGFYRAGYFKKGFEHLKKQFELDPSFESTEDLMFVFQSRVERWARVPEKVVFDKNEQGDLIPRLPKKSEL